MNSRYTKRHLPIYKIAKINLKHNALLSVLAAATILGITPVIYGTANLDKAASAAPLEMFVSLIGIVLFTPVFQPEQNKEIHDLVSSKYVSIFTVYLIRILYAFILITISIGLSALYMKLHNCDVTPAVLAGTAANAVFLGALGMITAALAENTTIAYMVPMIYYAFNYGAGSKLGPYYLFSMSSLDFKPKIWLFLTGIPLVIASLIIKYVKRAN